MNGRPQLSLPIPEIIHRVSVTKDIRARRTSVPTGEITRAPSHQSKLVPRQVPEFKSSMVGLEGLNQAFANFFGQASRVADNVGDAIAFAEAQRIKRENEAEKATAVGDALAGRPMSAEGAEDYDYYDTYRAVLAEKTGVEASREFMDWYRSDFLVNSPDGDLSDARQKWAEQHLGGSDDPEFQGMSLGTFYKSTEEMIEQHREARTKALFAKGSENVQAVIDNDVETGQLTSERLTGHIDTMRKLDPLNAAEAAPRVAAQLGVAIQNHPNRSEAVLATLSKPGTGINGKSFQNSFPEAYAKLQQSAVTSFQQTNTFEEMEAVEGLKDRAARLADASTDDLVNFHSDLLTTRQRYGAGKDIAGLQEVWAKEVDRRANEHAAFQGMITGAYDLDVSILRKTLPDYMKKELGIANILQASPDDVAKVFARSGGVAVDDHKAQLSAALVSPENPTAQARAVQVLQALEKVRGRNYATKWLDAPAERLYNFISDEQQLTNESLDATLLRVNGIRNTAKPFDSWTDVYPDKMASDASAHVRDEITRNVTEVFADQGVLGTGFWRNKLVIPPDVRDQIESYARSVVLERGTQGVDPDKAIAEAVRRTAGRGEVLPRNGRYVLTFDDKRNPYYVGEDGKPVVRTRLGFNEFNPKTGETVNTLGVYRDQLQQLQERVPHLLHNGDADDIALAETPAAASRGSFAVYQRGTPIVFEDNDKFTISGRTPLADYGVRYDAQGVPMAQAPAKPDRTVTFSSDEAELSKQMGGLLPEGFGFLRVPIGVDKFGWMLAYRPNFGGQEGISLEEREGAWQVSHRETTIPDRPLINPKVWQEALPPQ
ncbi:MAG: hypothetical protein K0R27_739 [Xanthobacteraceae bacterium]|jgi:hypothetical protein|nr:hypothetical protein [Xanthobacteraceae bacterium]